MDIKSVSTTNFDTAVRQKQRHKIPIYISILILIYLFSIMCSFSIPFSKAQDNSENPDSHELHLEDYHNFSVIRSKRQWGCPNGCFSSCMNSAQCQRYQLATVCVLGCCCPAATVSANLSS